MSKAKGAARPPPMSLFHVPPSVLADVSLSKQLNRRVKVAQTPNLGGASTGQRHYSTPNVDDTAGMTRAFASARVAKHACHTCGGIEFESTGEQRSHFKTTSHQANVAVKLEWRRMNPDVAIPDGEYPWCPKNGDEVGQHVESDWSESDDSAAAYSEGSAPVSRRTRGVVPAVRVAADGVEGGDDDDNDDESTSSSPFLWFTPAVADGDSAAQPENAVMAYGIYRRVLVPKGTGAAYADADQVLEELVRMQLPAAPVKTQKERMDEKKALVERQQEAAKASRKSGDDDSDNRASGSKTVPALPEIDPESSLWTLVSSNGGFFAAAVFDNRTGTVVAHKTIQRYTTRRKQGGLQSRQDSNGGCGANSAGAQIRRYNERKLLEETHELLRRWQPLIAASTYVFVRVPRTSRKGFFPPDATGPGALQWGDGRIRSVPVTMGRPTLAELQRVYRDLTTVRVAKYDLSCKSTAEQQAAAAVGAEAVEAGSESDGGDASDHTLEPEPRPDLIEFLYGVAQLMVDESQTDESIVSYLCDNLATFLDALGDAAMGLRYLDGLPGIQAHRTPTLLHLASALGREELVGFLMDNGEDPTVTNGHPPLYAGGMTAYEVAKDRSTRDVFRIYRFEHEGEPDGIEWERARVPAPLSHEQQRENQERAKEKKRKEQDKRKQRAKEQKERKQRAQQTAADEDELLDKTVLENEKRQQQSKYKLRRKVGGMSGAELHARTLAMASAAWSQQEASTPASSSNVAAGRPVSPNTQRAIDRELRYQAAERRRQKQQPLATGSTSKSTEPCTHCGKSLHGLVPFEQFDWKCCSIGCLHEHQAQYGA